MRPKSNPWVLLIGAAIISVMLMAGFGGNVAVKTHTLATQNKIDAMKMKSEFKQVGTPTINVEVSHEVK
jgi:uncharacterized membrane protein